MVGSGSTQGVNRWRPGTARRGVVWRCWACRGEARQGKVTVQEDSESEESLMVVEAHVRIAARSGSGMSDEQAQMIYDELEAMEKRDGSVTPPAVVDEAREPDSKLHEFFTWDDGHAAELYRRVEARRLIRVPVTVRVVQDDRREMVSVWVNVVDRDEEGSGLQHYVAQAQVMDDEERRQRQIGKLFARVLSMRDEMAQYEEMAAFVEEIDRHRRRLHRAGIEI